MQYYVLILIIIIFTDRQNIKIMDRHPYVFRTDPANPRSLYRLSAEKMLARYHPREIITAWKRFPRLNNKSSFAKAKRQLTQYFNLLNEIIKSDLLDILYNYKWESYRQKHRSILDKEMLDNDLCCTYPEECSGRHNLDLQVPNLEFIMVWKILIGKNSTNLNLLHFLDQYHSCIMMHEMIFSVPPSRFDSNRMNLLRDVERDLLKKPESVVSNVQQLQFFATYRGTNAPTWATLLAAMPRLQSLELHFWLGDKFFEVIRENCSGLRELILYRQRQGRGSRDIEKLPQLVSKLSDSLRVLIIDSVDVTFTEKVSRELQRATAQCRHLECLKLEADESPLVHWVNTRYRVYTKQLIVTVRRSYQYLKIIRNINRCINSDVNIHLTYDTYVNIDNHKHAYFRYNQTVIVWNLNNYFVVTGRSLEAARTLWPSRPETLNRERRPPATDTASTGASSSS